MKNNLHTDMSYLDILFEGKNKSYGAYVLRKEYDHRMRNAIVIMVVGVTAILFTLAKAKSNEIVQKGPYIYDELEIVQAETEAPKEIPAMQKAHTEPIVQTIKKTPPIIVNDQARIADPIANDADLKDHDIGPINSKGDPSDGRLGDFGPKGGGDAGELEKVNQNPIATTTNDDEIEVFVDQEAQYPGGEQSLLQDIGRNFRYPDLARTQGIEGTLYISFVVEKDGSISNVKSKRNLGYGMDEAGIAAIKKLKTFKAAKKDGKVVRSYFTAPIVCRLNQ